MVRLQTLGELRLGEGSAALSSRRKELVLLAYLARRSPRPLSRAQTAALLWEDRDERHSRQSLRQAVHELRRLVGEGLGADADLIWLRLDAVELDAALFEREVDAGLFAEAAARWRGDFLVGAEEVGGEELRTWLEAERESLRRRLRTALGRLVSRAQEQGAWREGIGWAERWLSQLPLDQQAQLHLLELLHLDGRTGEALARDAAFRVRLEAAGLPVSPELSQLAQVLTRAEGATQWPRATSAALLSPDLVGRGGPLAELDAAWNRVLGGAGSVVVVEGELGIGKTRLCEEFARGLAARTGRPAVYAVHARQDFAPEELAVVRRLAGMLAGAAGLAGAPASALAVLARLAPAVRERFPALPEGETSPERLADALREAVAVVAEESPTLLFVDDLPQADPASRTALLALAEQAPARCLLLLTARTGPDEPPLAIRADAGLRRLKLQPLALPEVELVLSSILELPADERHQLAARLHQQGGGNPFYLVELVSALADEGTLAPTERGAWRLTAVGDHLPLPTSLREVIGRRVARLSPSGRSALEAAAILALPFDRELLAEVADESPVAVEAGLEELMLHRLIREAEAPGHYGFAHELVRRHVAQTVPVAQAESMAQRAVVALERRAGQDPAARAALAQHRARLRAPGAARRWRRVALGAVALAAAALTVATTLVPPERRAQLVTVLSRKTPPLVAHRIVVAPLTNHTGDSTLAALGALAADWIAQGLMRTTQFEVVDPRTASVAGRIVEGIPSMLRDRNEAIAIAEETGSGTVVSGDLFREGDSLRVLMQVIDAGTGKIVRAMEPVSGTVAAPTRLVAALGEHVLATVASAVDTTSRGFSAALEVPPSYEAYVETSKAWESFFREDFTDVFRRLDRASQLDSTYIAPLLMRAYVETRLEHWAAVDTLVRRLTRRSGDLRPAERAVLSGLQADLQGDLWGRLRAARELVRLTPASVEGYTLAATSAVLVNRPREAVAILDQVDPDRGLLLVAPYYWIIRNPALHRLGQHQAEVESARQGIRRFPQASVVHTDLLVALAALGDMPEVRRELRRVPATDADPAFTARERSLYIWRELHAHGHPAAGAEWLREVLAQPAIPPSDTSLAAALVEGDLLAAGGRWTAARARYAAALVRSPHDPTLLGCLGVAAAHLGERAEALRLDRALAALSTPYLFGTHTYARARIAAALGDLPQSVELLRRAWTEGRPLAVDNRGYEDVHSDPELVPLRDVIAFQVLMRTD